MEAAFFTPGLRLAGFLAKGFFAAAFLASGRLLLVFFTPGLVAPVLFAPGRAAAFLVPAFFAAEVFFAALAFFLAASALGLRRWRFSVFSASRSCLKPRLEPGRLGRGLALAKPLRVFFFSFSSRPRAWRSCLGGISSSARLGSLPNLKGP